MLHLFYFATIYFPVINRIEITTHVTLTVKVLKHNAKTFSVNLIGAEKTEGI